MLEKRPFLKKIHLSEREKKILIQKIKEMKIKKIQEEKDAQCKTDLH